MRKSGKHLLGGAIALGLAASAVAAPKQRATPYWVSLAAREAMMRTGPGVRFPATWKYVRPGLPLKVLQVREEWRRVEDPDGIQGWVKASLLSERRTAIVTGDTRTLHAAPDPQARVLWRAARGVVGKIAHCQSGWCEFDAGGRVGYVEVDDVWGVSAGEEID